MVSLADAAGKMDGGAGKQISTEGIASLTCPPLRKLFGDYAAAPTRPIYLT